MTMQASLKARLVWLTYLSLQPSLAGRLQPRRKRHRRAHTVRHQVHFSGFELGFDRTDGPSSNGARNDWPDSLLLMGNWAVSDRMLSAEDALQ